MATQKIYITESELKQIVEESVRSVLDEGLGSQLKAGFKGAIQGFKGQRMLDRGADNFKQNWDREDEKNLFNPYARRPENTASMQANEVYERYKEYQSMANKLLGLYNKLTKKYNLNKDSIGKRSSKEKITKGSISLPKRERRNVRDIPKMPKLY